MSYTQVFGGTTIYPSDVSYLSVALSADKALEWPLESNDPANPAARIIDVTATGAYSISLPDATQTGAGQTILFNNLSASSSSFYVKDFAGNTLATVGVGEQWQVYLAATTTAAGTWRVFRYGASTATVQPSTLAGYGIAVTANTLSQSTPVTTFTSSPRTVLVTDRAAALVWTGTGTGTLNLPSTVTVGNNFFVSVRNSGGGDLTIDPAGTELVDGASTLALRPGDSTSLITDGITWYTVGLGQEAVFAFDYTSISVTGGTYTLSGSELNRIAYKFVGTLTSDCYIVVPSTIQQYWVDNSTTGSYGLFLQTSGGTPVGVGQGTRGIYYCNGTNVLDADTSTISLPVSAADGGTGLTNYAIGDLLYASGTQTLSRLADVATGNTLLSGGVGVVPSWGKVGLATHVSGVLPVANGGTNLSSYTTGDIVYASGAGTLASLADVATGNVLLSGGVGVAPAYGKVGLTTHITGTLAVGNGGTGATTLTGYVKGSGTSALTASATIPASDISSGAALTRTNDTNVTLTLGGSPTTSLLAATSLTLGWTGTLAVSRGGTGAATLTGYVKGNGTSAMTASSTIPASDISSGAALTKTDDTNVTLTLGGTPTTALLAATSLTLGWTGTLAVSRGGTGAGTLTGYVKGNGTLAMTASATVPTSDLTGTLGVANGGTGATTLTGYVKGSGTSAMTASSTIPTSDLSGTVSLTTQVSGTLPVGNGGTGAATLTGLVVGNGTSAFTTVTAPSGTVVGTTDTQTLTNKTITQGINAQTGTTYTLAASDPNKLVTLSNASSITLTVPPNSSVAWTIGNSVDIAQLGAGQVTVAPGSGVTLRATPGLLLRAQYSGGTLIKIDTDEWLLVGDLSA